VSEPTPSQNVNDPEARNRVNELPGFQMIETAATLRWQRKLLPLMGGMLVLLTIFFCVASVIQLKRLQDRVQQVPPVDLSAALDGLRTNGNETSASALAYSQWKTLSYLEGYAIQRRYNQATLQLMNRIWVIFLGFITGMILALVGAAFILGKISESTSKLGMDSVAWKFSIATASPGLILCVLGTALMITTILAKAEIRVEDGALYLQAGVAQPAPDPSASPSANQGKQTPQTPEALLDRALRKLDRKNNSNQNQRSN